MKNIDVNIREAFNKKNILLLTFVNNGGGSGASFVNKKKTIAKIP